MSARTGVHALRCLKREFYQRSGLLLASSRRNFTSCLQPWIKVDTYGLLGTNVDTFKTTLTRNIINAKVVRYDIPQPVTSSHTVTGAQEDDRGGMLMVYWKDGSASRYPYVWLRDNCKCPRCFQGKSNRRILHMRNVDVDVKPTDIQVNGGTLKIRWSDGHASFFESPWLHDHRFSKVAPKFEHLLSSRKPIPWGQDLQHRLPQASLYKIVDSDRGLYNWFCTMEERGLYFIKGNGKEGKTIADLTERISNQTSTLPKVSAVISEVGMHTDLSNKNNMPGVRFVEFSDIVTTMCGEIELADGFFVAELMRRNYTDEFCVLTTTPVEFMDMGSDSYKLYSTPTILTNRNGNVKRIVYNNKLRWSRQFIAPDDAVRFYKALKLFDELLQQNKVILNVNLGDVLCFHNHRVLYGRPATACPYNGEGYQLCGFLNWDELVSRRRSLQTKLSVSDQHQRDIHDFTMLQ